MLALPVDLIELKTPKWRAEYVKSGLISPYDLEGRHPLYWYARLDGGLYAVEEVIVWLVGSHAPLEAPVPERISLREGVEVALYRRGDALFNPCYNYIDMESSIVVEQGAGWTGHKRKHIWKVYIFYLVGKWVDWISLPSYADGRFTAEGYANPAMRPVAFVVRYAPYDIRSLKRRATYSLGAVYFCRYLDPPAGCKDAAELNGMFVVHKVLDDGRWYVKIDTYAPLNKPGLYTFELIAEDLRAQGRRCSIMHYAVEVLPK